ncbi:MAG: hypothetical protein WBS22_07760, partial [Methylocystis sp.]
AKVSSGDYASESEVIRDGLRALLARDRAVENWMRQEVVPAYDRMKADPSRGRSVADARAALAAEHERATIQGSDHRLLREARKLPGARDTS